MRRGFQVTTINQRGALIVDIDRVIKDAYRPEKIDLKKNISGMEITRD